MCVGPVTAGIKHRMPLHSVIVRREVKSQHLGVIRCQRSEWTQGCHCAAFHRLSARNHDFVVLVDEFFVKKGRQLSFVRSGIDDLQIWSETSALHHTHTRTHAQNKTKTRENV